MLRFGYIYGMILIHSKEDSEDTTEAVIDWLDYYGAAWARVNGEDLMACSRLRFSLAEETLLLNGQELPTERVRAVWYRRGGAYKVDLPAVASSLRHKLHDYLRAEELPETFYLTLFQEELEKEYELRIFCLDGDVYGMAIFSQLDQKTKVDFRNYNLSRPNRVVPYAVPAAVHTKINYLLANLGLTNGSVDMVRTVAGEYVFLEVNPTGQFGMVSEPCNYYLEQRMAEFLLKKAHENPHTR